MDFREYIVPACLCLIPVLNIIGWMFKKASFVNDKYIPLLLGGIGIILAEGLVLTTTTLPTTGVEWANALVTGLVQGILCAGTAVFANQIVKQGKTEDINPASYMNVKTTIDVAELEDEEETNKEEE